MNFLLKMCVGIVGFFLTSPLVYADGCHVGRSYGGTAYSGNTVYANNTYYPTNVFAIPLAVLPQSFWQVAPEYSSAALSKQAAKEGAKEAIDELRKSQPLQRSTDNPLAPTQSQPPPTIDPLAGVNLSFGSGNYTTGKTRGNVNVIFKSSCIECHSTGDKLDLSKPHLLTEIQREKIADSVAHFEGVRPMPPGRKLPVEQIKDIQNWRYNP